MTTNLSVGIAQAMILKEEALGVEDIKNLLWALADFTPDEIQELYTYITTHYTDPRASERIAWLKTRENK